MRPGMLGDGGGIPWLPDRPSAPEAQVHGFTERLKSRAVDSSGRTHELVLPTFACRTASARAVGPADDIALEPQSLRGLEADQRQQDHHPRPGRRLADPDAGG